MICLTDVLAEFWGNCKRQSFDWIVTSKVDVRNGSLVYFGRLVIRLNKVMVEIWRSSSFHLWQMRAVKSWRNLLNFQGLGGLQLTS